VINQTESTKVQNVSLSKSTIGIVGKTRDCSIACREGIGKTLNEMQMKKGSRRKIYTFDTGEDGSTDNLGKTHKIRLKEGKSRVQAFWGAIKRGDP